MKKTILAEKKDKTLLRVDDVITVGNKKYKAVSYEIWSNKDKMKQEITSEEKNGNIYIYCQGRVGCKESEILEDFLKDDE
jgi:hypothetical protein